MASNIVNFAAADNGTGSLVRAVPKVDPNSEGAHQWDIDLVFGVDEEAAEHVAGGLPGVNDHLASAKDGQGSAQITIKPTTRDIRLTLMRGDLIVAEDVAAEIRHLRMHLTKKAQNYVARLRLHGIPNEVSAQLVAALGKPVQVHVTPSQLSMDFAAKLGQVVSANVDGEDIFGVLRKRTKDGMVIDNFGLIHTVDKITAAIQLEGDWELAAKVYAKSVKNAGGAPTWRDLISALAEVGDGATVTSAVVGHALKQYDLPAEAGANG